MTDASLAPLPRRLVRFRLDSIRNRILAFALMATLVPAGAALGLSYLQNRRVLEARVTADLLAQGRQGSGAVGVWLKERLYDLRVFASSDEVSINLAGPAGTGSPTSGRLHDYLVSLHDRFADFEQIAVIDRGGRVVATSLTRSSAVQLPADWLQAVRIDSRLVGSPYFDAKTGKMRLVVAVPVRSPDGRLLGGMAAVLNLAQMHELVRSFARDSGGALAVVDTTGTVIARSDRFSPERRAPTLALPTLRRLLRRKGEVLEYASTGRVEMVGTLEPVPQAPWAVVAELPAATAYRDIRHFRAVSVAVVAGLLLLAAAAGWRFGLLIARPLDRLTRAASEVAAGDLAVDLPPGGAGEVGSLTAVFNDMVRHLREGRRELQHKNEELERLSATDSLTGLANHRALVQRLADEGERFGRTGRVFSVIMADVDRFKQYNDTFGHPAGDEVLKRVATLLREATRTVDCVARYGGEEFALVLPETDLAGALQVAERIRLRTVAAEFPGRKITLSIGVAEFPMSADSANGIIAAADEALYRAKGEGRNRIASAEPVTTG